jgi:hypothetical protein
MHFVCGSFAGRKICVVDYGRNLGRSEFIVCSQENKELPKAAHRCAFGLLFMRVW